MRKIERRIQQAINTPGMFLNEGNTTVHWNDDWSRTDIRFHGHLIAEIHYDENCLWITNAGYATNTTKARLNCILNACGGRAHVFQKDWVWHLTRGLDATEPDTIEMNRGQAYCVSL